MTGPSLLPTYLALAGALLAAVTTALWKYANDLRIAVEAGWSGSTPS